MCYLAYLASGLNPWAIRLLWGFTETFGCENVGVPTTWEESAKGTTRGAVEVRPRYKKA